MSREKKWLGRGSKGSWMDFTNMGIPEHVCRYWWKKKTKESKILKI